MGRRGPGAGWLASPVGRGFEEGLAVSSSQCSSQVRKVNGSGVSIDFGKDYYRNLVGSKSSWHGIAGWKHWKVGRTAADS